MGPRLQRPLVVVIALALGVGLLSPARAGEIQNAPPTGTLDANLQPPSTFFHAEVVDPDGDALTFQWSADLSCGTFHPGAAGGHPPEWAEWKHGGDTDCQHQGDVTDHEGVVTVEVSDGNGNSVTCEYEGSGGTFDDDRFGVCEETVEEMGHDRSISIRFNDGTGARNNRLVVFGRVSAGTEFEPCIADQRVNVQRRVNGRWVTKKTATTNRRGRYAVEIFDLASRYRAVAPRTELEDDESNRVDICRKAIRARRHLHRR